MASGTAASRRSKEARARADVPIADHGGHARRGPGGSVNVLIADAHRPFREGLRINLRSGFLVLGEAANVAELKELIETTAVDLILVAQDLPGGGLLAAVEAAPPSARIVVFADEARGDRVIEALQLGVSGYLLKSTPASSLGLTLQAVMRGEPVVDHSLVKTLVAAVTRQAPMRRVTADGERPALTPREQQVAVLLGSGSSTREIAEALGVSAVTARRHISSLMRKLQVATRDDARELIGD
ncbi:MAG: response regulator transcription factor [Gaiellaceae bacterium]